MKQGPAEARELRVTGEDNGTGKGLRDGQGIGSQLRWGGEGAGGQNQRGRELAGNKGRNKVG